MKKFFQLMVLGLIVGFIFSGCAGFDMTETKSISIPRDPNHSIVEVLSLTADDSDVALSRQLIGFYLTQVELLSSLDTAITFTVNSSLGSEMGSGTGDYTTAEYIDLSAYRYIDATPTYTLSGLGSGTLTVRIIAVK